ncbi:MAG: HlyD family efflux transporter periplasmic adaptor subunit [Gammaproteobacteria bacterium]|nr:HlyD family efflux transporter periplasmic adaptor subunit [Gammaproteobacteria bacterium]
MSSDDEAWQKIGLLRPRLRTHVQIFQHQYRGEPRVVLQDSASSRHYLLDPLSYRFVSILDGELTVAQTLDRLQQDSGQPVPGHNEIMELLGSLYRADMLQFEGSSASAEVLERIQKQRQQAFLQRLLKPLAIRFPLFDPDRLLTGTQDYFRPLLTQAGFLAWSFTMLVGLMFAVSFWPELMDYWAAHEFDPRHIFLLWIMFPVVKALHEAGHAMATRVWGGEVHEVGIILLVLIPIPYVDASAASAFENKHQRIVVSAVGIMVELFLAVLAFLVWIAVDDGVLRELCFSVMLIGSISTLLFNGNPLLRFDGYYVLSDLIEIPNLGARSNRYLAYLVERYAYRMDEAQYPAATAAERSWYFFYGLASFIYRILIVLVIALLVAGKMFIFGVLLAIWVLLVQFALPTGKYLLAISSRPYYAPYRKRIVAVLGSITLSVYLLVFVLPMPAWTTAQGILTVPEQSILRAHSEGFIDSLLKSNGSHVNIGEPLLKLANPLIARDVAVIRAQLHGLQYRQQSAFVRDKVTSAMLVDEINSLQARLDELMIQQDNLTVSSPVAGTLVIPNASDAQGRFVNKGDMLAYVLDHDVSKVRVVVSQSDVDLIRRGTLSVKVRLPSKPQTELDARIEREVPAARQQLPSRSLGSQAGGDIAVDSRDTEGLRTIGTVFEFDVILLGIIENPYYGSRVYVRFEHNSEPIANRWLHYLNNLYLQWLAGVNNDNGVHSD